MSILVTRRPSSWCRASRAARARSTRSATSAYGTQVVAGVTPGKGGKDVEGIPVFNTVADAVRETGRQHGDGVRAAALRGRRDLRGRSTRRRARRLHHRGHPGARHAAGLHATCSRGAQPCIGPNCPGVISPGIANVGIMPAQVFAQGRVGLVQPQRHAHVPDRQGAGAARHRPEHHRRHRRRPGRRHSFIDVLGRFQADPETGPIVMVGEIGGDEEEKAADYIAEQHDEARWSPTSPASQAPPGKQMGHAGAIITGSAGTAQAKKDALEAQGDARRDEPDRGRRAGAGPPRHRGVLR